MFDKLKDMIFGRARGSGVGGAVSSNVGMAKWSERDFSNFAKEAYLKNYISYRCIDMIAQSVASVDWNVYKLSGTERVEQENNPFNRILNRVSPTQSWAMNQYVVTSFLALDGNSFIEKLAPETGPNKGIPIELCVHRPDHIKYVLDDNTKELIGYALETTGEVKKRWEIDPLTGQCDLLHLKKFHPLNDIEGLSPVEPSSRSIDTSNEALTWNKKLLQNDARPGTIFVFDGVLGDDQFKRLKQQLNNKYAGAENAGRSLVVEGNMKDAKPFGFSPKDMDFLKGNWDLARQICLVWGVPPQLLGIPGDSTYANFEQARLYFWETTVFFYLMLLRDEYNNWFFPLSDEVFIDYKLDNIPALSPRRQEKWKKVQESDFLTINEKREEVGLEKYEGGDVILVPANMVPLDAAIVTEEEVDDAEEVVEEEIEDEELQEVLLQSKDGDLYDESLSLKEWLAHAN